MELTEFDKIICPLRGQMMVEPFRGARKITKRGIILETDESVPPTVKAKVLKFGPGVVDPGFGPGDIVEIVPHGGHILPVPKDHPERLVVPVRWALGVWDE